jgi:hypothetical protein
VFAVQRNWGNDVARGVQDVRWHGKRRIKNLSCVQRNWPQLTDPLPKVCSTILVGRGKDSNGWRGVRSSLPYSATLVRELRGTFAYA